MKRNFVKKTSIFLSTLLMTQALLTGCGSGGSGSTAQFDENGKPILEVDENGKVNGLMNPEGLPIVDNKGDYSFSLFVDNSTPLEGQYVWPMLEEQTNVQVDVKQYAYEIAKEKYGLALSSGDYTDVIGGWCLSSTDILTYGVDMGIFIPLEGYFEEFAPNIMKLLEMPGVRETMTAPDGHIYSIPYVTDAPKVDFSPFINQKWLDNLGLKMPTNTEELREVLRAFKAQDANGNGNPNDEIPFSSDPNNRKLLYLAGWFGLPMESDGFTMIDGKLEFGANREEYKKMVEYMASLNAEGLLDPEFFTQDLATWKGKGNQDLYGVSIAYNSGDFKQFMAGEVPDFRPLPVLSSPDCPEPKWLADTNGVSTLKNQVVITDKAKNPEIIVRWWDNVYSADNSFQILNGPIGVTSEKVGEDKYKVFDRATLSKEDDEKYSWANMWTQSLPKNMIPKENVETLNPGYPENDYVDEAYEPYFVGNDGNGNYDVIPSYWVQPEFSAKLSEYTVSITDYINQKTAAWISGQADVNAEWDSYLQQLDKLGLQEYIKIRQEAIGQK